MKGGNFKFNFSQLWNAYMYTPDNIYIYIYDYNLISILKKKKKRKTEKKENSLTLTLTLILSLTLSISIFEQYRLEPLVTHITVTKIQRFSLLGNLSPPPHSSPPPQYQIVFITHLLHVHLSDPNAFVSRAIASLLLDSHLQPSPSTWDI